MKRALEAVTDILVFLVLYVLAVIWIASVVS